MKALTTFLLHICAGILVACSSSVALAQIYDTNNATAQVFAGSGLRGYIEATGTQAMFAYPVAVAADSQGNLVVADNDNRRIRKISPGGETSAFVGGGNPWPPGYGTSISLNNYVFGAMVIDHTGVIWITTAGGLLRIQPDSYTDFLAFAGMDNNSGLCVDSGNNLYWSSTGANRIYRIGSNGALTTVAGSGAAASVDGNGQFASFHGPRAIAVDTAGNLYVWDERSRLIRRIDQDLNVTTIAGNTASGDVDGRGANAGFLSIYSMTTDGNGNIIMACGSSIRRMSASTNVTTIAGSFTQESYANGIGSLSRFSRASGVCISQGKLFVADSNNHRVRQITFNPTEQEVIPANLSLRMLPGLSIRGLVGRTYRIESSTNATSWKSESLVLLTSSPQQWIDQNAQGRSKLYRAFLIP